MLVSVLVLVLVLVQVQVPVQLLVQLLVLVSLCVGKVKIQPGGCAASLAMLATLPANPTELLVPVCHASTRLIPAAPSPYTTHAAQKSPLLEVAAAEHRPTLT